MTLRLNTQASRCLVRYLIYEYEYEYDDQIVCAEVEKSLFEKKIEKKECKAYNKQGASKRPNVEV